MSSPSSADLPAVRAFLLGLQTRITTAVSNLDGQAFLADSWQKALGEPLQGNGITQILEGGPVFERAGCGFSHVRGPKLPPSATQHRPELVGAPFEAMGVSLVFHPRNPYVPTVHMNVRMLAAHYTSLAASPPSLTARLLEVDEEEQTPASRKRWRFLSHMPLTGVRTV